jgi:hypothetical protein
MGQVTKFACIQTGDEHFLCEINLVGACPEIDSYFGFVADTLLSSSYAEECITARQIQVSQPASMVVFVAIGLLIIVLGLLRAGQQNGYIP